MTGPATPDTAPRPGSGPLSGRTARLRAIATRAATELLRTFAADRLAGYDLDWHDATEVQRLIQTAHHHIAFAEEP